MKQRQSGGKKENRIKHKRTHIENAIGWFEKKNKIQNCKVLEAARKIWGNQKRCFQFSAAKHFSDIATTSVFSTFHCFVD